MSDTSLDPLLTALLSQVSGKTSDSVLELSQRRTAMLTFRGSIDQLNQGIDQIDSQLATVATAETKLAVLKSQLQAQRDHLRKGRDGIRNALRILEDTAKEVM